MSITMRYLLLAWFVILSTEAKPSADYCNDIAQGLDREDVDPLEVHQCSVCDNSVRLDGKVCTAPSLPKLPKMLGGMRREYEVTIKLEEARRISRLDVRLDEGESSSYFGALKLKVFFKLASGRFVPISDGDGRAIIFDVDIDASVPHEIKLPIFVETSEIKVEVSANKNDPKFKIDLYGCGEEENPFPAYEDRSDDKWTLVIDFIKMLFQSSDGDEDIPCNTPCRFYIPGTCECDRTRHDEIYEMDILLDQQTEYALDNVLGIRDITVQHAAKRGSRDWQNFKTVNRFEIPYTIARGMSIKANGAIREAIKELSEKTCIDLIQATSEHGAERINFVAKDSCSSPVGKSIAGNQVSIGRGCEYKGTVLHEIMHSLGFWHEQGRYDRNDYVTILKENIQDNMMYNFNKRSRMTTYETESPYDLRSLMHYDGYAFSKNGKPTIAVKGTDKAVELQRTHMSAEDINRINKMYPCDCVDERDDCDVYKPLCDNSRSKDILKVICRDTCGFCEAL